jgi:polar amino acid transport system substrate-binding protein
MQKKASLAVIITVILCLGMAGISAADKINQDLTKSSVIDRVIRSGKLRVGLSSFVPWAMQDKEGKWIGFEVDVATKLAEDMGVKLELVPTKWEGLIPSLTTGKFDLIIAGMMGTPQRALKINFTQPYDYSGMMFLVNKKYENEIKTAADLNKAGITLLARLGTTPAAFLKEKFTKATLRVFPDEGALHQEMLNGKAHAMLTSIPTPQQLAAKHGDTVFVLNENMVKQPICMGVPKGDPDTLAYLNNWITVVRNSGFLKEKADYWWWSMDWESRLK